MQDMGSAWEHLDREVAETPMPAEYSNLYREVLCKDCSKSSKAGFHVVGMKCGECGSYNTSIEGPFLRKTSSDFVALSETDLQRLYAVPLPEGEGEQDTEADELNDEDEENSDDYEDIEEETDDEGPGSDDDSIPSLD